MRHPILITSLLAAALSSLAAPAHADVPTSIPFAGRLVRAGTPVNGTATVAFRLFTQQSNGTAIWEETQSLGVDQGLVYARLGAIEPIDPGLLDGALFLEVEVMDGSNAGPFTPRLPIESVPFAIHARTADTLGDLTPDKVQTRVDHECPAGSSIRAIAADGSVTCEADDDTPAPTYSGSGPITVAGTSIGLANSGCAAGDVWKWNGSAWSCDPDSNTAYTAGSGIAINNGAIGLSASGCASGDVWKWNGATWACAPDTSATYAGASPITVTGNTIGLSASGCAAGDVWKWTGTTWSCAPDTSTTYSGSAPISVNGTTVSLTPCPANQIYKMNAAGTGFACAPDASTSYTAGTGIDVTGGAIGLSTAGCAAGYVWKYNGTAFACVPDGSPGLATFYGGSGGLRPNGQNQVAHVTVNAPTNGNLLATLTYGLAVKTNAVACNVPLKLSLTSGDIATGNGFQQYFWPNTMQTMDSGTGYGTWPSSITAAFPVTAGSRTVFFNSGQIGAPNCADFLWTNVTLTVMFVPNSIGTSVGAP
ncbi:MAG: hypothetical protein K8W52_21420 [Deltaproteobacteria bacterium]|nr:hypothetical protein [Deltaproteobacteria bacterium]